MKSIALLAIVLLMFSSISTLVLAEENETETELPELEEEPGIGPKSKMYWFDNMGDRIRFAFAFGNERKAQVGLEIAEERLAELEALNDTDPELLEKAQARYENYIERATEHMEKVEAKNQKRAGDTLGKITTMQERLELHHNRSLAIKERILEKRSENMTEEQLAHLEEVFSRLENRTEGARERLSEKEGRVRAVYQLKSNATNEEVEELMEQAREQFREKAEERVQKQIGNQQKIRERVHQEDNNSEEN